MIICADDFGLAEDIDQAILELCRRGKLSAVSCLALPEACDREAFAALQDHRANVDVGLHLCLTRLDRLPRNAEPDTGGSAPRPGFGALVGRSLTGRLSPERLLSDIEQQYERFVAMTGCSPDHLDGHLHVHQLAGVREAVIRFVARLPAGARPYVRNTRLSLAELRRRRLPWMKAAVIGWLGARMEQRLRAAGIPTNNGFAGLYDFRHWDRYPRWFPGFIDALPQRRGMLVVHPGTTDAWRRQERVALLDFTLPAGRLQRFGR